ncbi:hypothetical protein Lfu02_80130 [Longispora fulva]|uniref:Uncharacterized protein n=1 Tax=Longispora fulva TaxID=619741 RepID=A0A8J7H3E1_9ACTN|nr:DUF5403 family protein [Longispora fulva]MBG6140683.1 hypothetical protein [Longispora fulva]GIG63641.1 hypothetical protein Lfu02_80130 [Longispora fulva]
MPQPRKGIERRLARLPVVKAEVRAVAEQVLAAAKARAAEHSDDGTFAESLYIGKGKTDLRVESDDPAAQSKEFGHLQKKSRRPVPGMHALGGAAADVAGGA